MAVAVGHHADEVLLADLIAGLLQVFQVGQSDLGLWGEVPGHGEVRPVVVNTAPKAQSHQAGSQGLGHVARPEHIHLPGGLQALHVAAGAGLPGKGHAAPELHPRGQLLPMAEEGPALALALLQQQVGGPLARLLRQAAAGQVLEPHGHLPAADHAQVPGPFRVELQPLQPGALLLQQL